MKIFYKIMRRKYLYLLADTVIILLAFGVSYIFRFYPYLGTNLQQLSVLNILAFVMAFIPVYYFFQSYRTMWTYSNVHDIYKHIFANVVGLFLLTCIVFNLRLTLSRLIIILSFFIIICATTFYRVFIRDFYSRIRENQAKKNANKKSNTDKALKKILIIGAGEAGRTILGEYIKQGMQKNVVGFIDDDKYKKGKFLNGKPILGNSSDIGEAIENFEINSIIIAMPSAESDVIFRMVSSIEKSAPHISIKTLPHMVEMVDHKPLVNSLRKITITDLIGREEFSVDRDIIKSNFSGKTILITGAGGSIGSELCRQLLKFNIKRLVAVGKGEFSIYNLAKDLNQRLTFMKDKPEILYKIADIKDYDLLKQIFETYRPEIVFHAAAHKHVPLMEFNEVEALQNNVGGSNNLLKISSNFKVEKFVLISTDKAVNPTNVMGATKRMTELLAEYYHRYYGLSTAIVRFGNVLGSRGSVVPLFREQIESGGPVTITHPDIKRFFMSIPEASLLVINAGAYANGGETFVLNMGEMFKIKDIAKKIIRLYGLEPDKDIEIKYTGLRPGEKLYEELYYDESSLLNTDNDKIFIMKDTSHSMDKEKIEKFINEGLPSLLKFNSSEIREIIKSIVEEYDYCNFEPGCKKSLGRMVN